MCKRSWILLMMLVLLAATACGSNQEKEADNGQTGIWEKYGEEISNHTKVELQEGEEAATNNMSNSNKPVFYEVSDVEAAIVYEGQDFRKSVFCAGADMLYIYGIKPDESFFLGCMRQEEAKLQEISHGQPEEMRAVYMAVDKEGSCHVMWISVETSEVDGVTQSRGTYERVNITVVDKSGEPKADIDLSELFKAEGLRPSYSCFTVDNEGSYYIGVSREMVKLGADGKLQSRISCDGVLQAVGCGRSGDIYCIYMDETKEELVGRVEWENGIAQVVSCGVTLPPADALYLNVAAGADTELLFYNKAGGVYAYDAEKGIVGRRVAAEELPVLGGNVSGYGFLGDGRLCLLTTEKDKQIFYYVPTGEGNTAANES